MDFQYVSDLHLEMSGKLPKIKRNAANLILAGDIGNPFSKIYKRFIQIVSEMFDKVFLITGNHEYYNTDNYTIEEIDNSIREYISNYTNVYFLQNEIHHFNDEIVIFGSTYWTHIETQEELIIKRVLNDYNYITNFTVSKCNELHDLAIKSLEDHYAKHKDKKWIIILHHVPYKNLTLAKYHNIGYNSAFASNEYPKILDEENVIAIIYGHTHTPSIQGKYFCNAIGYPSENLMRDYNKKLLATTY